MYRSGFKFAAGNVIPYWLQKSKGSSIEMPNM